jgi:hypothetical protein
MIEVLQYWQQTRRERDPKTREGWWRVVIEDDVHDAIRMETLVAPPGFSGGGGYGDFGAHCHQSLAYPPDRAQHRLPLLAPGRWTPWAQNLLWLVSLPLFLFPKSVVQTRLNFADGSRLQTKEVLPKTQRGLQQARKVAPFSSLPSLIVSCWCETTCARERTNQDLVQFGLLYSKKKESIKCCGGL